MYVKTVTVMPTSIFQGWSTAQLMCISCHICHSMCDFMDHYGPTLLLFLKMALGAYSGKPMVHMISDIRYMFMEVNVLCIICWMGLNASLGMNGNNITLFP